MLLQWLVWAAVCGADLPGEMHSAPEAAGTSRGLWLPSEAAVSSSCPGGASRHLLPLLRADGSADDTDDGSDLSPALSQHSGEAKPGAQSRQPATLLVARRRNIVLQSGIISVLLVAAGVVLLVRTRRQVSVSIQEDVAGGIMALSEDNRGLKAPAPWMIGLSTAADSAAPSAAATKKPAGPICNGLPGLGRQEIRRWELPFETNKHCWDQDHGSFQGMDVPMGDRNWCWVGLKRRGCHSLLELHENWQELTDEAVRRGGYQAPQQFQPLLRPEICDSKGFGVRQAWSPEELQQAADWFQDNVNVFVLNMNQNVIRWKLIEARLKELGIPVQRVEGVDMREVGALQAAQVEGLVPSTYDFQRAKDTAWASGLGGILGRVGCASAHFRAQAAAMDAPTYKRLAVVFEDDVWPEKDFMARLWQMVTTELPCDWEAVSLSSKCPYGTCISQHLSRVQPDGNEPADSCHGGVNYGFQGVLYNVDRLEALQAKWKRVVFNESRPHCFDVDVALASISDRVAYYAVPFSQAPGFLSEILQQSSRAIVDSSAPGLPPPSTPACASHKGCDGLQGDCCPAGSSGVRLSCCGTDAPAQEICGKFEMGVDYIVAAGVSNQRIDGVAAPDNCCSKCRESPTCKAWTWVQDAGLGGVFPGQCWLKGGVPTSRTTTDGVVSGLRDEPKVPAATPSPSPVLVEDGTCAKIVEDIEYMVYDAQEKEKSWAVYKDHVATADECCALCNSEPSCGSWTFVIDAKLPTGPPGQCWIKGGKPSGSVKKEGILSGLRVGSTARPAPPK